MIKQQRKVSQSYAKRVTDVNNIYDRYAPQGLCNREIWRRYVYPLFAISERTFYNLLKASAKEKTRLHDPEQLTLF